MAGRHSAKARERARKEQQRQERYLARRERGRAGGFRAADEGSTFLGGSNGEVLGDFSRLGARPRVRPPRSDALRRHRGLFVAMAAVVVVAAISGGGYLWADSQANPAGGPGKRVVLEVPTGASASQVASLLSRDGVLHSPLLFRIYMRLHPVGPIGAGPYLFHKNESYSAVERTLKAGPNPTLDDVRLTIPEGLTVSQIAQRVGSLPGHSAASFLSTLASGDVHSSFFPAGQPPSNLSAWEGILFPDTYLISPNESDAEIAQQMATAFEKTAVSLNLISAAANVGLTPYKVIIVASILQREAKTPSDMAKVAQVIYNRLKEGMKLQLDSTVQYALSLQGETVTSELTDAQTSIDSPYNTYRVAGLPPGPISAPGEAALRAALQPTPGPWLYYVTIDRQGDLAFATSLAQQNQNIAAAARNGCPAAC